jgi:hypothetical protein
MVHKTTLSTPHLEVYSSMIGSVLCKGRSRCLDGVLRGVGTPSNSQITISGMRT